MRRFRVLLVLGLWVVWTLVSAPPLPVPSAPPSRPLKTAPFWYTYYPVPLYAAGSSVQECHNQVSGTTVTCTFGSSVTVGSVILVGAGINLTQDTLSGAITDNKSNTYTTLQTTGHAMSLTSLALGCAVVATGGTSFVITVPWTTTGGGNSVVALEVTGVDTTGGCAGALVEGSAASTDPGTGCGTSTDSATSGTISVTSGNYAFGVMVDTTAVDSAAGTGFTTRSQQDPSTAFVYMHAEDKSWPSTASLAATFTPAGVGNCSVGVISLKVSGGAPPPSRNGFGLGIFGR